VDSVSNYQRKQSYQHDLYRVDLDPFAVNVPVYVCGYHWQLDFEGEAALCLTLTSKLGRRQSPCSRPNRLGYSLIYSANNRLNYELKAEVYRSPRRQLSCASRLITRLEIAE
jgi:hypothetical protein